ncbi:MAG TPA: GGIII-like transmembrane region-containing protein [Candidatus Bathyarchaeia archaeon]|nr:GGIII-like transmembrane region-containing protein [Candidatus Bathyarchaeia archaeon]
MFLTKKKKIALISISLILLTFISLTNSQAFIYWENTGNKYMTNNLVNYVEDFTTTTFQDPITDAVGWGTGTLTNPRDYVAEQLDFYETLYPVTSIDVQGRNAYYSCYNTTSSLYVINSLDINDPENLFYTSGRASLLGTRTIAVNGDTLYTGRSGVVSVQDFNSYNISDPYNLGAPSMYLDYLDWDGQITDIELEGNLAYFAAYQNPSDLSLGIADITDPDSMIAITHDWDTTDLVLGLDVIGHLAYLATGVEGLFILNISSTKHPVEIGFLNTPGNATDVLVDGRFAYLVDGNTGLQIIDVSNPTSPSILGTYNTPGFAQKLAKQGNTLFIADGSGGVQIIDVSDPFHPLSVTDFALPYTYDLVLSGDLLFVATENGIYSYRIGGLVNLANSAYANPYDSYTVMDVRVIDGIAFIAGGNDEFIVLNVKNPSNPIEIFKSSLGGIDFYKIDVNNQFAFLVNPVGIYIFDISDLSNIHYAGYAFGLGLSDICVVGKFAYVSYEFGFAILNYTDITALTWHSINNLGLNNVTAIDVQGYHVYLTEWLGGSQPCMHVVNIIDTINPFITYSRTRFAYNYDIQIDGNYIYLAGNKLGNGFWIYNATNSYTANINDSFYNNTYGVWGFGQYILTANYQDGVTLVDARNLNAISARYSNTGANRAFQITTNGDLTYVANLSSLVILRHFASMGASFISGTTTAQSITISDASFFNLIVEGTLEADDFTPPGTTIKYYMTADGINWEEVIPGIAFSFVNQGKDLRWKAEITGPKDISAHIYGINIEYTVKFNPMWYYIFGGAGGGLLLIIIIIIIASSVKHKKKRVATR